MKYCTGRCMCHHALRIPFELDDVTDMVGKIFAGRVTFHDGTSELASNITIHKVGGHSKGLQIVRVMTRRGWIVLGSDASHFYDTSSKVDHFQSRKVSVGCWTVSIP